MNYSIPLFRIFGIPVKMHWTLPVLMAYFIGIKGFAEAGRIGGTFYLGLMAGLFVTVLVHELGHCWAAHSVGGHADEIILWPLGGFAFVDHNGGSRDDIKVAAWGPLMHVPLALLCVGTLLAIGAPWSWGHLNLFADWIPFHPFADHLAANLLVCLLKMQIMLFFFNLLVPAAPLDGGRILTNILLLRYDREKAALLTVWISIPIGLVMIGIGLIKKELFLTFFGVSVLFEALRTKTMLMRGDIDAHPLFAPRQGGEFREEPPPRRPGFFARWRARRVQRRMEREAAREAELEVQLDAILEKISREGMPSLSVAERKALEEASKRARMK